MGCDGKGDCLKNTNYYPASKDENKHVKEECANITANLIDNFLKRNIDMQL